MRTAVVVTALALAVGVTSALAFASQSDAGTPTGRTIGLVFPDPNMGAPLSRDIEPGAQAAAAALGDTLLVLPDGRGGSTMAAAVKSLIAKHVSAIIVNTDQGLGTVNAVQPALAQARAAGIPTLSYEQQFPGSTWITQSTPQQYARALADTLASQMNDTGGYMIVGCRPSEHIVTVWLRATESYVGQRYPHMHLLGVAYGDSGNGDVDTNMFARQLKAHPQLRGLIYLCPGESSNQPPQIVAAHKVGKVFSAGNGGDCPPLYIQWVHNVGSGAEQVVCGGVPSNLGYLVVWAADYLASGHTFAAGSYDVGDPVGTVQYLARSAQVPLGPPLVITKANLAQIPQTTH
jgi:ABC-type sugar transport system substrate-binding protein